jgi:hypothetical protein
MVFVGPRVPRKKVCSRCSGMWLLYLGRVQNQNQRQFPPRETLVSLHLHGERGLERCLFIFFIAASSAANAVQSRYPSVVFMTPELLHVLFLFSQGEVRLGTAFRNSPTRHADHPERRSSSSLPSSPRLIGAIDTMSLS